MKRGEKRGERTRGRGRKRKEEQRDNKAAAGWVQFSRILNSAWMRVETAMAAAAAVEAANFLALSLCFVVLFF